MLARTDASRRIEFVLITSQRRQAHLFATYSRIVSFRSIHRRGYSHIYRKMSSTAVSQALTNVLRHVGRSRHRIHASTFKRATSSKHPRSFVPPTVEDLAELRDRVQEFTSRIDHFPLKRGELTAYTGREIPEELAATTDRDNEFPMELWKKLGEAG